MFLSVKALWVGHYGMTMNLLFLPNLVIAEQAPKMSAYVPPGKLYLSLLLATDTFLESLQETIIRSKKSDDSLVLCILTKGYYRNQFRSTSVYQISTCI